MCYNIVYFIMVTEPKNQQNITAVDFTENQQ